MDTRTADPALAITDPPAAFPKPRVPVHTVESAPGASRDTLNALEARVGTDRELADAFASVAANLFTNCFNHYVGTVLDLPAAPAASRRPAEPTTGSER